MFDLRCFFVGWLGGLLELGWAGLQASHCHDLTRRFDSATSSEDCTSDAILAAVSLKVSLRIGSSKKCGLVESSAIESPCILCREMVEEKGNNEEEQNGNSHTRMQ